MLFNTCVTHHMAAFCSYYLNDTNVVAVCCRVSSSSCVRPFYESTERKREKRADLQHRSAIYTTVHIHVFWPHINAGSGRTVTD